MPCRWLDAGLAGHRGSVNFVRKFGYPGNADPATEHIWITCAGVSGCVAVRLNSTMLTDQPCTNFAFDVTHLLSARNRLEVTIRGETDTEGLWGEVALEIRKDAYLADVQMERVGTRLIVAGLVMGTLPDGDGANASPALELYVLVDGRNAEYRTIVPKPAGEPFRIELTELAANAKTLRIDLIHVSTVWYAMQLPIPHWYIQ